ncbi:MAG: hypothetical protein C0504_16160 [Candidatus Solibacter sp.]|nr:hypothetical protein [Candidatus Solibacter sp.]
MAAQGGLLVLRSGGKIQFSEALDLEINGKDKAFSLPGRPEPAPPPRNLPSFRLGPTLVKDAATGVVAAHAPAAPPRFLFPDGLSRKTPAPAAEAWKESVLSYKKAQSDKTRTQTPAADFVAYLAGGVDELAGFCMDEGALRLAAGEQSFQFQLELTAEAVASYKAHPAMAGVGREIQAVMEARLERFDKGIDSAKSLDEGLRLAELSSRAYPDDAGHGAARQRLAAGKVWLDRRIAVLRALAAGSQWDSFVLGYGEFEKHQASFPELAKRRQQALQSSLDLHWKRGKERLAQGQTRRAWEELRLASYRRPSEAALRKDLSIAWTEYSRQAAVSARGKRKALTAGERDALNQSLHFASRYREQNKLDEAMKSVLEAERIDPAALPVLLAKAEVLAARSEITSALAALDQFDLNAVDEERAAGAKLRNELMFSLTSGLGELRRQVEAAWGAGRYHESLRLARRGLLADSRAPEFLYYAGLSSLVTRDREPAVQTLNAYLEASNTLDADAARRASVLSLLASLKPPPPGAEGEPNWFSGAPVPSGSLYCPISLAFQPRVDRIQASNRLSVRYTWEAGRLKSIVPSFEKAEQPTGEKPFVFTYHPRVPHALAVELGDAPRQTGNEIDSILRATTVLLPNNPYLDAGLIRQLTGRRLAVTVAGNRFFNPFVWERPYMFALDYDERGRVKRAQEIPAASAQPRPPVVAEFAWDDYRLASIRVFQQTEGASAPPLIYERSLRYQQGRLAGEEIRAGGRSSSIKYNWKDGQLVSAECDKDESLDNRSREVFFATPVKGRKD